MRLWRYMELKVTIKSRKSSSALMRIVLFFTASLLPMVAFSDEVVLKAADGSVNVSGELLDFIDDNYVIRTTLGEFRISASRVRCEGEACPNFDTTAADVVIAGSDTVGLGMMPLLLTGYASFLDAETSVKATEVEGEILASFVGEGGYGEELGSYLVTSTTSGDAFSTLFF